jgi:hypothetical protein
VIEAYIDESCTHRGATTLCVACYAGDRERWNRFEEEWSGRLRQFGIPLFHAKDKECDKLRPYLVEAISNADLKAIVCSINPSLFNIYAGEQLKSTLGNAYSLCALACGLEISKWRLENELEPVAIFLESGQQNDYRLKEIFELLVGYKEDKEYHIASVTVASKKDYLPLQASDFLSHVIGAGDTYWTSKLIQSDNFLGEHIKPEQMTKLSKEIKALYSYQRNMRKRIKRETP